MGYLHIRADTRPAGLEFRTVPLRDFAESNNHQHTVDDTHCNDDDEHDFYYHFDYDPDRDNHNSHNDPAACSACDAATATAATVPAPAPAAASPPAAASVTNRGQATGHSWAMALFGTSPCTAAIRAGICGWIRRAAGRM